MRTSSVIGGAVSGIASRSFHPHWAEVSPIKRQGITPDEKGKALHKFNLDMAAIKAKLRVSRVLPVIYK